MLATALLATIFARIGYLHRMAEFHAREAERQTTIAYENGFGPGFIERWLPEFEDGQPHSITRRKDKAWLVGEDDYLLMIGHHRRLSRDFRYASYRPWCIIDESMPKEIIQYDARIKQDFVRWERASSTKNR